MVLPKPLLVLLPFLLTVAGCASFESSPAIQTLHRVGSQGSSAERAQFDPRFHYLRVVVDSRVIFMASDTQNIDSANTTSVWYSAGREVLRFQDGRLVAAVGMDTEWRGVVLPELPTWAVLAQETEPLRWMRIRDVMPGYHYGIRDALVLRRIPAPSNSKLKGLDPHSLIWFEEQFDTENVAPTSRDGEALPPARYALDEHKDAQDSGGVVYGEQCLAAELCFSWQRWPVQTGKTE